MAPPEHSLPSAFGARGSGVARLRTARVSQSIVFVAGGEEFVLPKPFLAIHSPYWGAIFHENPELTRHELENADPASFRAFVAFLNGASGADGDVTAHNVLDLLRWGKEFGVDYITSLCEDFLLSLGGGRARRGREDPTGQISDGRAAVAQAAAFGREDPEPMELLEIAARYDMPLLYSRATEKAAQGMSSIYVADSSDRAPLPAAFGSKEIREDLINAHITMGLMRNDGESRRRYRFADHTAIDGDTQRSRLLWKSQARLVPPPEDLPAMTWKSSPTTVWPHHSLRDETWAAVPSETQPPESGNVMRARRE